MRFGLFLGCLIPARFPAYELSARRVLELLGVELVDLGTGCCGSPYIHSVSHEAGLALAAWNLSLAEEEGLKTVMTLCSGCHEVLSRAVAELKDISKREEVNALLSKVGREYKGEVEVKHLVRVLYEDLGLDKVREAIKRPLDGLRVAVHYGCHLLRPSEVIRFENPHGPKSMDELVEATGATSIPYEDKLECCGFPALPVDEGLAYSIARDKLASMASAGADLVVTACPSCFLHFENTQIIARRKQGDRGLPVLHITQLLGLAMGLGPDEVGLRENRVRPDRVLELLSRGKR
ncbi:CoB--CoM heterodisulfide reductase subunit B [Candidatus Bathyarchaeota archaeon]|nr:MAG: CoB--CoM heterodisulfide reductase subunit B [Candidatus Bathyarchaeota archaeon]